MTIRRQISDPQGWQDPTAAQNFREIKAVVEAATGRLPLNPEVVLLGNGASLSGIANKVNEVINRLQEEPSSRRITALATSGEVPAAATITEFLFTADPDTGLSNPSANTIDIVTGNAVAWRILSTGELRGPDAATSSSNGTMRIIRGGSGGSSSGNGGALIIVGGIPTSGNGGALTVSATDAVSGNNTGGLLSFTSGGGTGSAAGGNIIGTAGRGGATGQGGTLSYISGGGGLTSGNSGSVNFSTGATADGDTGQIVFSTNPAAGTNRSSGQVKFNIGDKTGAGAIGNFNVQFVDVTYLRVNGTTKHLSHLGTVPTLTSGGGGVSSAIVGTDECFIVTIGTTVPSATFKITYATAFTNAPVISAQSDTDIVAMKVVSSTTTVDVTVTGLFTAGSKVHVISRGYE